jgi:hypothetical protein
MYPICKEPQMSFETPPPPPPKDRNTNTEEGRNGLYTGTAAAHNDYCQRFVYDL